nr:CD83 antigen isoform X2 [Dromaius novaehollandiae]
MSSIASAQLFILCNVWCLIRGASVAAPDVAVRCAEEVLLPCKVRQDSTVTYQTVSWYKMAGHGEGKAWKVLDVDSHHPEELGGSLELSNDTLFSLKIKNATSHNSGTYRCILREQNGERNLSGTVTLKVSGCPGILEDEKLKKYKAELFMLTCLGIFYLLLIFFTCEFYLYAQFWYFWERWREEVSEKLSWQKGNCVLYMILVKPPACA